MHYIYIKKVDNSIVKVGHTEKYDNRYKQQADQLKSEFDNKELLHLFQCNDNEEKKIESDFKKTFKQYQCDKEGSAKELYFWTNLTEQKYLHWLRQKTIKEVGLEREREERKQSVIVIIQPQQIITKEFQKNIIFLREI